MCEPKCAYGTVKKRGERPSKEFNFKLRPYALIVVFNRLQRSKLMKSHIMNRRPKADRYVLYVCVCVCVFVHIIVTRLSEYHSAPSYMMRCLAQQQQYVDHFCTTFIHIKNETIVKALT